jgi:hypothetical protein
MNHLVRALRLAFLVGASAAGLSGMAQAQATRTWVSGVGDDVNPCSRTAPCKTFAGAISKTAACGEINAIDPGGYGAVTITKPMTIDGGGTQASILASLVNGVVVNMNGVTSFAGCPAGAPRVVTLRNLSINGSGDGINGIRAIQVDELHVENVRIMGFRSTGSLQGNGIDFNSNNSGALFVSNSIITDNVGVGVFVRPQAGASASATLNNVQTSQNGTGVLVADNGFAAVTQGTSSSNVFHGYQAVTGGAASKIHLDRSIASGNGISGVRVDGAASVVRLSGSTVVQNATGLSNGGGTIATFGNNTIAGNLPGGDGATNLSFTLK